MALGETIFTHSHGWLAQIARVDIFHLLIDFEEYKVTYKVLLQTPIM